MAKNNTKITPIDDDADEARLRGKRKPREYRFESVTSDGTITALPLIMSHKASAKAVMKFLNDEVSPALEGNTYRFTEMIIHQ